MSTATKPQSEIQSRQLGQSSTIKDSHIIESSTQEYIVKF